MVKSQNLIKNPSFEDFHFFGWTINSKGEKQNPEIRFKFNDWKSYISPDPFCLRKPSNNDTLNNYYRDRFTFPSFPVDSVDGNFFVGLCVNYEMIRADLIEPMVEDSVYLLTFYFMLEDRGNRAPKGMSIVFSSDSEFKLAQYDNIRNIAKFDIAGAEKRDNFYKSINHVRFKKPMRFVRNWGKAQIEYKAKGGETYMYLFNRREKSLRNWKKIRGSHVTPRNCLYVFVDNFKLEGKKIKISESTNSELSKSILNIDFEVDSCRFQELYGETLDSFYNNNEQYFRSDQYLLRIIGNTDNSGDSIMNELLSLCRAEAIKNYIIGLFETSCNIRVEGNGERNPLNSNSTPIKRKTNRRVELVFEKLRN